MGLLSWHGLLPAEALGPQVRGACPRDSQLLGVLSDGRLWPPGSGVGPLGGTPCPRLPQNPAEQCPGPASEHTATGGGLIQLQPRAQLLGRCHMHALHTSQAPRSLRPHLPCPLPQKTLKWPLLTAGPPPGRRARAKQLHAPPGGPPITPLPPPRPGGGVQQG